MKRNHTLTSWLWLLMASLPLLAPASRGADGNPPNAMSYQGYLTDADGHALANDGPLNYRVFFKIYDHPSASDPSNLKWEETQIVTVDKGYFSAVLGSSAAGFSSVFKGADSSDRYMQLQVEEIAGVTGVVTISPRQRFLPGPYSFMAGKAREIDVSSTSVNRLNSQALFFHSDASNPSKLGYLDSFGGMTLGGPALIANTSGLLGTGGGGDKGVLKWTSDGRVGINNDAPATELDVSGTVSATLFSGSGGGLSGLPAASLVGSINESLITTLNATKINATAGKLNTDVLPTSVARTDLSQSFSQLQKFPGYIQFNNDKNGILYRSGTYSPYGDIDGPVVYGNTSGLLATREGGVEKGILKWNANGINVQKAFEIQTSGLATANQSQRLFFDEDNDTSNYGFSIVYAASANPSFNGTTIPAADNTFNIVRHANSSTGESAFSIQRDSGDTFISKRLFVGGGDVATTTVMRVGGDASRTHIMTLENDSGTDKFQFDLDGTAKKSGGGEWASTSDRRLKHNIKDLTGSLDKLLQLRSVTFEYNDPVRYGAGTQIGFVAQEVEPVFPQWVSESSDGMKVISISGFPSLAVQAFRELKDENAKLRAQLADQDKRLKKLEELQGIVESLAREKLSALK